MEPTATHNPTARLAGLIYLVVVLTGIFSLAYVPGQLIVWDDAATTFDQISASEPLFRLEIVSGVVCYIAFLLLPLVLYRLLRSVNETYARLMVALAVVSVPLSLVNLQNKLAVLSLTSGDSYLNALSPEQLQAQVMFYLNQYDQGILLVSVFWGLWLLPFGYLVFRSGFLPKVLGILLMLGCLGYLTNFLGNSLVPGYSALGISSYVRMPATLGEIGTCLWLLIVGVRKRPIT